MARLDKVGKTATTITRGETLTVRYHQTEVVRVIEDKIILNTGGWRTVTTKARMNQAANEFGLGYYVFQKDYKWFVEYKGETIPFEFRELELTR